MEKHRAIPEGYMTVGEVAKKTSTTVRTLQYYDKEGLLTPSAESEGGRRLYTHKDIVRLRQIQAIKYLGFTLDDIKSKLPRMNTPAEVSATLTGQAEGVREMIKSLKGVLKSLEKLNAEVVQMESVNWQKYAEIATMLHSKNPAYWIVKHVDDSIVSHAMEQFDNEAGMQMNERYSQVIKRMAKLQKDGHEPDSDMAVALAKDWWDYVMEVTKGKPEILAELIKMGKSLDNAEWFDGFAFDKNYLEAALTTYFTNIGYNPFDMEGKHD